MNLGDIRTVVERCKFYNYTLAVIEDSRGSIYLQATYAEEDTQTGHLEVQHTRRWFLSPKMSKSEIVQTVFKCCLTSMEHRTREWFRYEGQAVFGPHFDVDALHALCKRQEFAHRDE